MTIIDFSTFRERPLSPILSGTRGWLQAERLDPTAVTPADLPPALPELERWKVAAHEERRQLAQWQKFQISEQKIAKVYE